MSRALNAPLSLKEETTLRRIKAGIRGLSALPAREVERLKQLDLVEQRGHRVILTRSGQARAARLPVEVA